MKDWKKLNNLQLAEEILSTYTDKVKEVEMLESQEREAELFNYNKDKKWTIQERKTKAQEEMYKYWVYITQIIKNALELTDIKKELSTIKNYDQS